jgi:hypothetical protein
MHRTEREFDDFERKFVELADQLPLAPLYLLSENFLWIAVGFIL